MKRQLSALVLLLLSWATTGHAQPLDLAITGGTVMDGSGLAGVVADIGVSDGRIVLLEADQPRKATETFDATGMIVAPGFIDLHTHARADLIDPDHAHLNQYLTQGVSTVLIGNDGGGAIRINGGFAAIAAHGSGVNVAQFTGHATLRKAVMDRTDRAATPGEIGTMEALLHASMKQGSMGLSSGLFYADGNHAETSEMIALSKVVAQYGGIYESHIRSESSRHPGVLAAVNEAIEIGRESGAPVHIAHIKVLGKPVWGLAPELVAEIDAARARGLQVTADQYPWQASSTQLRSAVLSREWQGDDWRQALDDLSLREALLKDIATNIERRGGPNSLMMVRTGNPDWDSFRLGDIAEQVGVTPQEMARRMLREGTPRVISFNMQETDIITFMQRPWVATSSDGTVGHPRRFASFPRKYNRFVRQLNTLRPEAFVRSASGLPADILGLQDRGYIRDGYIADLLVFDPAVYAERATFLEPEQLSVGVRLLLVNGEAAILDGELTGVRAGQAIRRQ